MASFAVDQMAGRVLSFLLAQSIGFSCRQCLRQGHRFQSCRSTPVPTYGCKRRTDFGAPSKVADLVRLLLRSLPGVGGISFR